MTNTRIEIQNLKCGGCEATIMNKLSKLNTIDNIQISTTDGTVSFNYSNEDDLVKVKEVLKKIGYPPVGDENGLLTKTTSYVSCAIGRLSN